MLASKRIAGIATSMMVLATGVFLAFYPGAASRRSGEQASGPPASLANVEVENDAASPVPVAEDRVATSANTWTRSEFQTSSAALSPRADGWQTESAAAAIANVLHEFSRPLDEILENFAPEFTVALPRDEPTVLRRGTLQIRQQGLDDHASAPELQRLSGDAASRRFLRAVLPRPDGDALAEGGAARLRAKVIRISQLDREVQCVVRFEASSLKQNSAWQQNSHWLCRWAFHDTRPQLLSAEQKWTQRVDCDQGRWFEDETLAVVGNTPVFRDQLSFGLHHWLGRVCTDQGMNYFSKHGLAIGDVDGDGWDDIYVCQPGGLPNRLLLHNADGTVRDASREFGVDLLDRTASALLVDLDNDGDQDLVLATLMGTQFLENVDQTRFEHRLTVASPDIDLQGLSAIDYDRDGDLDLYQTVDYASVASRSHQGLPAFVYHDANDGGTNRLLQNNIGKQWQFVDVTTTVGLDVNNHRHSLAAGWCDVDGDGWQDLYVANDYGPNCLYRNVEGRFEEISATAGVTDFGSGMSVSWADFDRDGVQDLYVGNMFSSAGNRITTQSQFLSHVDSSRRGIYSRFAKGNSLFRNLGENRFSEVASPIVEMGRWAWSSQFADINNDAWSDLLVANGYITTPDTGDL